MHDVRVDPKSRVIRVRVDGPLETGEEEAVRLELSAGTALVDYTAYAILIASGDATLGALVEELTAVGIALGAAKIARVGASESRARVDEEEVADFPTIEAALEWLGAGVRR